MTIDVHAACQLALDQFNNARMAREAQVPSYDNALEIFKDDVQDFIEVCNLTELIGEDGEEGLKKLYEEPITDTLLTPKFYVEFLGDVLDTIGGELITTPICLIEYAGALLSESAFLMKQSELAALEAQEEKARVNYVNCLRSAGFQKSRRMGDL